MHRNKAQNESIIIIIIIKEWSDVNDKPLVETAKFEWETETINWQLICDVVSTCVQRRS